MARWKVGSRSARAYATRALVVLLGVCAACGVVQYRLTAQPSAPEQGARLDGITFTGKIRPASQIAIAAQATSLVRAVHVRVGEDVHEGQPLLELDNRQAQAALEAAVLEQEVTTERLGQLRRSVTLLERALTAVDTALVEATGRLGVEQRRAEHVPVRQWKDSPQRAQAAYDQALMRYQRAQRLQSEGVISTQELEDAHIAVRIAEDDLENARRAEAAAERLERVQEEQARLQIERTRTERRQQYENQRAELRQAELRVEQTTHRIDQAMRDLAATTVKATASGVVVDLPVRVGDQVFGGATLIRLASLRELLVEVQVAASLVNDLRVGQPVAITLPLLPPRRVPGTLMTINPIPATDMNHTAEMRFQNDTGVILTGQTAEVVFRR